MTIFPAIDLFNGCAVRLFKGDYAQMTVYSDDPASVARSFRDAGASNLHVVDLEGAKDGTTANFETIRKLAESSLSLQVGGGIRTRDVIEKYCDLGVSRVILGTAAVTKPGFVGEMVAHFGERIAVGIDLKDGYVAIKGWTEVTGRTGMDFCREMDALGVKTVICTDISKDGVLGGANTALYQSLSAEIKADIIASGGVTSLEDIRALRSLGLYGAILGKALYTGHIDLKAAIQEAKQSGEALR
ncbi:1-(5-phosphoribosyl)-5-[(5-phosphoribosylamino)methylideneamino]imidazole-4-carboxamide isomerase [Oscillospiraceae bacterium WX1]